MSTTRVRSAGSAAGSQSLNLEHSETPDIEEECLDPEEVALAETRNRILVGSLVDLPPLAAKVVRIFTSSTFTGKNEKVH